MGYWYSYVVSSCLISFTTNEFEPRNESCNNNIFLSVLDEQTLIISLVDMDERSDYRYHIMSCHASYLYALLTCVLAYLLSLH
jgi:hypothetical protein